LTELTVSVCNTLKNGWSSDGMQSVCSIGDYYVFGNLLSIFIMKGDDDEFRNDLNLKPYTHYK